MHLSYNELHRQAGKLSFCHRNITERSTTTTGVTAVFTTNFGREFAHGKILPMDSTLFQGSRTGDKLLLRFSTVILLLVPQAQANNESYAAKLIRRSVRCSRIKEVLCITVVYLVIGSTSDFLASSI